MGSFTKNTGKSLNKQQLREHLDRKGLSGTCMNMNCENPATHEVVFIFRVTATTPPATSSPLIKVCRQHTDVEWSDVCDDRGWENICSEFLKRGYQPPSKQHSCIAIRPITS